MINLCRDEDYRRALLNADLAIADSGFMVLLWRFFTGGNVPRISGLEHVKRLLEHESVRQAGAVVWVVATERSREKLVEFLALRERTLQDQTPRAQLPRAAENIYIAPKYGRPMADEGLLQIVRQTRPKHIVIAIGGGVQDKLGQYLLEELNYRPAVHCIGAALGFLTGDQVRIPDWADRFYFGWFFRSLAQPTIFIPRFWSARRLPWMIFQWREKLPPLEKN